MERSSYGGNVTTFWIFQDQSVSFYVIKQSPKMLHKFYNNPNLFLLGHFAAQEIREDVDEAP